MIYIISIIIHYISSYIIIYIIYIYIYIIIMWILINMCMYDDLSYAVKHVKYICKSWDALCHYEQIKVPVICSAHIRQGPPTTSSDRGKCNACPIQDLAVTGKRNAPKKSLNHFT